MFNTAGFAKVPSPTVLQVPEKGAGDTEPDKAAELLLQISWFGPALTTGAGVTITSAVSLAAGQTPLFVVVTIMLAVPELICAGLREKFVARDPGEESVPPPMLVHAGLAVKPEIVAV